MFVISACVGNQHLMWQHGLAAIEHTKGERAFVQAFNQLLDTYALGPSIRSGIEQVDAAYRWPMHRKDEFANRLWAACDMPPVVEFLQEHRPYFDWSELEDWRRQGHTVGFHTHTHPFCSRLTPSEVETEIIEPAVQLKKRLNLDSLPFAYPFGDRLAAEAEAKVADRGIFSCLLGYEKFSPRGTPPHQLDRLGVDAGVSGPVFGRPLLQAMRDRVLSPLKR